MNDAHLAIGCFAALCRDRLADRLLRFSREAPGSSIGVHELALAELLCAVRGGRLALAVAPGDAPGAEGLASTPLWHEEGVVALASNHSLAAATELTPEALAGTVTLLSSERAEAEMQRYLLARLFPGARPPLDGRRGAELMTRVAAGEGVALVLAGHKLPPGIVTRPVAAAEAVFEVRVWWRADNPLPDLPTLLRLLSDGS